MRTRILFYFIFDIKTCLWLTPHIIRVSHRPIAPTPHYLPAPTLWLEIGVSPPDSQNPNRNPHPHTRISCESVCAVEYFRWFLLFLFFCPICGRSSFIFVYVTNLIYNYIYFFVHCPSGPNSICCEPRNSIWKYQCELELYLKAMCHVVLSGYYLSYEFMQICQPQWPRPLPPSNHLQLPATCHTFPLNAKSKQDNLLC